MRLLSPVVAAILTATLAVENVLAQSAAAYSFDATGSHASQSLAASVSAPSPASAAVPDESSPVLPVSLDRIRDALRKPDDSSLLRVADLPVDFRIKIVEQRKIDEMLSKLDFSGGPVPAGGLYAYEQQQRLFKPTDRPLMQPYAAYNGGQFATIALENLIAKYVAGGVKSAVRSFEERAAKEEVAQAIADYCAARSDRGQIRLCNNDVP